jgi:hypothetical protein
MKASMESSETSVSGCSGSRIESMRRSTIDDWRKMYNEVRHHSSLNNLTPLEYVEKTSTRSPDLAVF